MALCVGAGSVALAPAAVAAAPTAACEGAQRISLHAPVQVSLQERAQVRALPPLRIVAVDTPPMAQYDAQRGTYTGISADVLCFMARELGLRYEFITTPQWTVAEKIQQVQNGTVDVFVPLSRQPEREHKGIFTLPYYQSHYAAIARKGRRLSIAASADLAQYRVGIVQGVALEPILQGIVPAAQLHRFDTSVDGLSLFQALRSDAIDLAVFNRDFFLEKRYRHELFDLETVHTLTEFPRAYGFYFSRAPQHEQVVALFDRYLAVMDISASLEAHEVGERQLMERYVTQRSQRIFLLAAIGLAALLALASYVALRKHRRLLMRLALSHAQVLQQQQELQAANAALEHLSQTDSLTRLANRRHFDQVLLREHGRCQHAGAPLSLLMVDIDYFKQVNDHYGHTAGDDYLRAVAQVLERSVARTTDVVARYGGEEFACLLPDIDPDSARALAERICSAVAQLNLPNPAADALCLTVSIGLASLPQGEYGEHSAQALLSSADAQLYLAKQTGRNRVCATVLAV